MLTSIIKNKLFSTLSNIEVGSLAITLPSGEKEVFSGNTQGVNADIEFFSWKAITNMSLRGDIGLTEDYRDGLWDTSNLTAVLQLGLQNAHILDGFINGSRISRMLSRVVYLLDQNTTRGSRRNIQAHYDLGNEFYKLWLDDSMSYSAAIFEHADEDLQPAQWRKYDRICDRIELNSGRVLEVGCGWGGFAERVLNRGDFDYKGVTLSDQQHSYSTERLQGRGEIALQDYRQVSGKWDAITSIEMFEAVGEKFWPTYFEKMASLLNEKGKAVLQTITVADHIFPRYRSCGDMIRSFIFPGGMLPSPSRFNHEAEKAGFRVNDRFFFGQDYAETLRRWLADFEQNLPQVRALGFDEGFIRVWRFYLAGCVASFAEDRTDVMQVELQKVS